MYKNEQSLTQTLQIEQLSTEFENKMKNEAWKPLKTYDFR